jgi:hypothetical protein
VATHTGDPTADDLRRVLDEIIARGRARAQLDQRTEDEIPGYDADGLPT